MGDVIYESFNPANLRSTTVETNPDGGILIVHHQDTKPVIEACKIASVNFDPHGPWRKHGYVRVASIPLVIAQNLKRQGILDDPQALDKWLDERDNRVFRTDDARRLS